MHWLSFCVYCRGAKWSNKLEYVITLVRITQTLEIPFKASQTQTCLGLYSASSCLSYFQWLRFLPEKSDFLVKHAQFIFLYRGESVRLCDYMISNMTTGIRYNFGLKQRENPRLLGIWHWPNFLWKTPKLNPLKRKGKEMKCQCLYIHRDREIQQSSQKPLHWCRQDDWLGRLC